MPYARNGDVELYYETFGNSTDPTLLLVNGLGSQCINFRAEWCEMYAAEGFQTVRFDNRDVGLSTKLPDVSYTLSDMAGDAVAVLDELGVDRAHVVGFSLGGMIVQTLAIEHADRLLSMTSVMSTTGDADVGNPSREALSLFRAAAPTDRDSYIARYLEQMRTWGSPACYDEARLSARAGAAFDRCHYPEGQVRQALAALGSESRTEALRHVRLPALVLHGDQDRLIDPSGGRRTAEAIPGARFELIEGLGHDYPPEHWATFVRLVTEHARASADV
jgi:pimeloyl-ACP methyl ester carboxylesterase